MDKAAGLAWNFTFFWIGSIFLLIMVVLIFEEYPKIAIGVSVTYTIVVSGIILVYVSRFIRWLISFLNKFKKEEK